MKKGTLLPASLFFSLFLSFAARFALIAKYKNMLTVCSDDINYIKSAVYLLKNGLLVYHNYNEPTVYIMPLYPYFLAAVFKIFGHGLEGLQAVRIIQAVMGSVTILYVFFTARWLFDMRTAALSSVLVSIYMPNITTPGYMLTETMFTMLFVMLNFYSLYFSASPSYPRFLFLGFLWACSTMCRPIAALFPIPFFIYFFLRYRPGFVKIIKLGAVMLACFVAVFMPWWIRNYRDYGTFIPLTASGGNPMLQGTYINYLQTPENRTSYKLGKNTFETNKIEVETAVKRIKEGFKKDFWRYLLWYSWGKTKFFWGTTFYWKEFFGISYKLVLFSHYLILSGFIGMVLALSKNLSKYLLLSLVMAYFNIMHCIYMAFDRYAYPVIPLLSIFSASFFIQLYDYFKRRVA